MYITITPQKTDSMYAQSASDFVNYLEKENRGKSENEQIHFFNHYEEQIFGNEVIREIDGNTAKLKKREPKFYSITLNPCRRELGWIQESNEALKRYTREVMKEYAQCFNREIDGKPVFESDIKYYAIVERQRTFKGTDQEVRENRSLARLIYSKRSEIRRIEQGVEYGNLLKLKKQVERLEKIAPNLVDGRPIESGLLKPGPQSHIHIIVSRKDASNRYSLSPGSKYKATEVMMHGKAVKRGFDRDQFFRKAEKSFDKMFDYPRNYLESYKARNALDKYPLKYFTTILGLPTNQKAVAFKILGEMGFKNPVPSIPRNTRQLTVKAIK